VTVPVYEQYFRWLGYGDAIDPVVEAWRAKDRAKAVQEVPRDLIEDIFILGDADAQRERLDRYADGGVTTPVLQLIPFGADPSAELYTELAESLAPRD
jgi:hypothetical protein